MCDLLVFKGSDSIDIKKIQLFLLLAQLKNFSKVANISYMNQSTVSKQINQLEEELGVTLFNRKDKANFLTPEGEIFWKHANEIINIKDRSVAELRGFSNKSEYELRVGATSIYGEYLLPKVISRFKLKHPNVKISLEIGSSHSIYEKLKSEELDICFLSNYISYNKENISENFYMKDELVFICSDKHSFSNKTISFEMLEKETFIIKSEYSSLYKYIKNLFLIKKPSFSFKMFIDIGSQVGILELVRENHGVGIVSKKILDNSFLNNGLSTFKVKEYLYSYLERDIYILHNKKDPSLKKITSLLIDIIPELN